MNVKKLIEEQKQRVPPPHVDKWYVEDAAEFVNDHRKHCTDPTCKAAALGMRGRKMVAMLLPQKLSEIFFAVCDTGTNEDYRPFMSLQLANPEAIHELFDADGNPADWSGVGGPTVLDVLCHREGVIIEFWSNGIVTISCKACGERAGVPDLRLAPQPAAMKAAKQA